MDIQAVLNQKQLDYKHKNKVDIQLLDEIIPPVGAY